MDNYYVTDILINSPHIKETISLPTYIRQVTGVLFFPVLPASEKPDAEPLGTVGLSLEYERLNVVTNQKIYKKNPIYFVSQDYKTAEGELLLDRGYSKHDFFECNDTVSANSFMVFKYTNRKMVIPQSTGNEDLKKLESLSGKRVKYKNWSFKLSRVEVDDDVIILRSEWWFISFSFHKDRLQEELPTILNPNDNDLPFFPKEDESKYDKAFTMKIILRYK